jgi:hypothetical protein
MTTQAAAPPAPAAATPPASATPQPAAASPPAASAAPAKPVVLTAEQKRQRARDNLAKAREAKVAKASAAPAAAPPVAPAATTAAPAEPAAPAAGPKVPTLAELELANRKLVRELQQLKQSGDATKADLELLAALRDPSKRWDALSKVGVSYDDWTQQVLAQAGVKPPDAEPVHPEVAKLRAELDELKGKHTTAEQAAQQAIAERDHSRRVEFARKVVVDGGDKYALTAALGREADLLLEHERLVREEAIDAPDPQLVAGNVEKLHEGALRKQLTALIATPKGKALLVELLGVQPQAAAPAAPPEAKPPAAPPVPNNGHSSERSSTNGVPADFYKWSPQKKREWASARRRASAN